MERFTSSGEKEKSVQDTVEYTSLQVILGFEYVHIYWIGLTSTGWTGMGVSCRRGLSRWNQRDFWMLNDVSGRSNADWDSVATEQSIFSTVAFRTEWAERDASSAWTATDGGAKRARAQLLSSFSTHRDKIRFISRTFGILLLRLSFSNLLTTNA
jgi:hypothetical protein